MSDWLYWIIGAVVGAGGLAFLAWSLLWDRSRGRRRCPKCWYDMTGLSGLTCPECGKTAKTEKKLFRTRRRWRWAVLGCVLIVAGGSTAGTRKVKHDGPFALVPAPVLNWVVSHFDEQADELYERVAAGAARPGAATRLTAWERVLVARGSVSQLLPLANIDSNRLWYEGMYKWLGVATHAENEVRLIAPVLREWVADTDHPRNGDYVWLSGQLAYRARPLPGLADAIEQRAERVLLRRDDSSNLGLWELAANDPAGRRTIPLALRVLHGSESASWRTDAVWALGDFVGQDERALDAVMVAVTDRAEIPGETVFGPGGALRPHLIRDAALSRLSMAGATAAPAIPRLVQLAIKHPDLREQIEATISAIRADMERGA